MEYQTLELRNLPNASRCRRLGLAAIVIVTTGCQAARVVTNQCEAPFVAGAATVDVTEGGALRQSALVGEGGRVGSERFDIVRAALLEASPPDTGITWALANADGTRLVVTHRTRVSVGDRLTVEGPPGRRDWGVVPPPRSGAALVAVILPSAPEGISVTGTVEVLRIAPLELRMDLRSAQGTTVAGVVRFRRESETKPCFS